jgi:hypothetical protein
MELLKCTCRRWQVSDTSAHIALHLLSQKDLETANTVLQLLHPQRKTVQIVAAVVGPAAVLCLA